MFSVGESVSIASYSWCTAAAFVAIKTMNHQLTATVAIQIKVALALERRFSVLRRLKTYPRNNMKQDQLNSCTRSSKPQGIVWQNRSKCYRSWDVRKQTHLGHFNWPFVSSGKTKQVVTRDFHSHPLHDADADARREMNWKPFDFQPPPPHLLLFIIEFI